MRTERQMMDLLCGIAQADERIMAAFLNGSRTNQNAPRDIFQDYDVVYVVKDTAPFIEDPHWLDQFGQRLYMQCPEALDRACGKRADFSRCYGYLMQMADGVRIDLRLMSPERAEEEIASDQLCVLLLDKEGVLPPIPPASDRTHWVQPPSAPQFDRCCNEFWWCLNNVAKGLWREELLYAMDMLNQVIRPELLAMLCWQVGVTTHFSCSVGKCAKYLGRYLPPADWQQLLRTYPPATPDAMWQAVFTMCDLFDAAAHRVAAAMSYPYDERQAANSRFFLENARTLPRDAQQVL